MHTTNTLLITNKVADGAPLTPAEQLWLECRRRTERLAARTAELQWSRVPAPSR
ncbi:MAG: hypothetical protein V4593_08150 [Pseudomonadota bacterium]